MERIDTGSGPLNFDFRIMSSSSNLTFTQKLILGVQMLFVAFGATVLVPLLTGLDTGVALFTAGVGTLVFHLITGGKVPIFLGSSFAFIAPITASVQHFGIPATMGGLVSVGLVYVLSSLLIKWKGVRIIEKYLPAVVIGPVIMTIGLSLAPAGIDMAKTNWPVALVSLGTAIAVVVYGRGLFRLLPIITAVVVGYVFALAYDYYHIAFLHHQNYKPLVDLSIVASASWFSIPDFVLPQFRWEAIVFMLPVAIAPMIEHVGDIYTISQVAGKNYVEDPGLHRTLLGDGIASSVAALFGGPPNTTYSEVTGALALIKVYEPVILRIAAITAILLAFSGKLNGFLESIPPSVIGGVLILLFGMIAAVGIRTLINAKPDLNKTRNLIIISVILSIGVGGAVFSWGRFSIASIGLAGIVGVLLNLILPGRELAE